MAKPDSLIQGNYYFRVTFYDEDLVIPHIETWIYDKRIVDENGNDLWLFREPLSQETPEGDLESIVLDENKIASAIDIHELQKLVAKIEDLQSTVQAAATNKNDLNQAGPDFSVIKNEIDHFLSQEESNVLMIGIKYSLLQGLSLMKRKDSIVVAFAVQCKIYPEIENKVRAFFQKRNLMPSEDYLANRGRIRILSYSLSNESSAVIDNVVNAFKEIYAIAPGDQFKFTQKLYKPLSPTD